MKPFKPEDFEELNLRNELSGGLGPSPKQIADIANARFEAWLKEQPEVFGWPDNSKDMYYANWGTLHSPKDTHRARLIDVRKIEGDK